MDSRGRKRSLPAPPAAAIVARAIAVIAPRAIPVRPADIDRRGGVIDGDRRATDRAAERQVGGDHVAGAAAPMSGAPLPAAAADLDDAAARNGGDDAEI